MLGLTQAVDGPFKLLLMLAVLALVTVIACWAGVDVGRSVGWGGAPRHALDARLAFDKAILVERPTRTR